MPGAVRFSKDTETRLKRAALRRGVSKSEYIRAAVEDRLTRDESAKSSWELLKPLCGAFDSGDPYLSQRDPGEIIRRKYKAERARYDRRSR